MKLHNSVIKELVRIFETHGGHREEWRLKNVLNELKLSTYKQNSTGKTILVLTKDLQEKIK